MLVITQADVAQLLPMQACIGLMRDALAALARGDGLQPLRTHLAMPDGSGILGLMPGYLGPAGALGIKVLTIFSATHGSELDSHQGAILLFEQRQGRLLAVIDATSVTAIRTAAVSAVATDLLAPAEAGDLAILGAGTQAFTHLEAMRSVREIRRLRIWNRTEERGRLLAARAQDRWGIPAETCSRVSDAVRDADLICTTTAAREPILRSEWVAPGAHLNVVGSSIPRAREVDTALMARARLFVDLRESALQEAGDVMIPIAEGAIGPGHIEAELGELLAGERVITRRGDEITLFKSLGIAIEDLAAARFIYDEGRARGVGTELPLGGQAYHG